MLQSGGPPVAEGLDIRGQHDLSALVADLPFSRAAAGGGHAALLRRVGFALASGLNDEGQYDLLALVGGLTYTLVDAGGGHASLLESEGIAVASWLLSDGNQCNLPALVGDLTDTQLLLVGASAALCAGHGRDLLPVDAARPCSGARAPPRPAAKAADLSVTSRRRSRI